MMDLIQLLLPQQTFKSTEVANDAEPALQQNDIAFIAMLANFLEKQDASEVGSEYIFSEVIDTDEEISEHAEIELLDKKGQEPSLSSSENLPLAWFDSESFEPPSTKLAIEGGAKEIREKNNDESDEGEMLEIAPPLTLPLLREQIFDKISSETLPRAKKGVIEQNNIQAQELSAQHSKVETDLSVKPEELAVNSTDDYLFKENDNLTNIQESTKEPTVGATFFLEKKQPLPEAKQVEMETGHSLNLSKNIDSAEWSEQFNHQIIWLSQQKIKSAIIKLTPPELGPLEVKVDLVNDETKINIRTQIPEVGELIEQAIPRLRDLMSVQGIQLVQVNIESNANQRHPQPPNSPQPQQDQSAENEPQLIEKKLNIKLTQGLIDYFA